MRIRHLSIRNFRGIGELDWALPGEDVICLAGSGDVTKSTILEAIRRILHPQWNLVFDDADFYDCKPANAICIEALLGDIPNEFRDLATYGYWLGEGTGGPASFLVGSARFFRLDRGDQGLARPIPLRPRPY